MVPFWVPIIVRHLVFGVPNLVAEWIHFTLFGIILPTIKLKVYTFGLMNSATKPKRDLNFENHPFAGSRDEAQGDLCRSR